MKPNEDEERTNWKGNVKINILGQRRTLNYGRGSHPTIPLLQQVTIATVYLKTLLPTGKSLVLHIGKNYPSQLGLYHALQTKIFALSQGGKRVTVTLVSPKTCNPGIPAKKPRSRNITSIFTAYIGSKLEKETAYCISCESNCRYLQDNDLSQ